MFNRPTAVLFDLDGTLVDTVETRIAAWLRAFDERGIPASRPQVSRLIGSDGRRLARVVVSAAGKPIDDDLAEDIDRRAGEIYDSLNTDPRPLPGVLRVLAVLEERRIPWAIATSSRRDQVGVSIASLRLAHPPKVIDGSHVERAKPAPDLLFLAARELGLDPSGIWYVGDSIWDMEAANAAGMPAVGVATGAVNSSDLAAAGAGLTLENVDELLAHLPGS